MLYHVHTINYYAREVWANPSVEWKSAICKKMALCCSFPCKYTNLISIVATTYIRFSSGNTLPVATVTGHCVQLSKHWPCPVCPNGPSQAPKWTCPCWASWRCWRPWPGSPGYGPTSFPVVQNSLETTKTNIFVLTVLTVPQIYIYIQCCYHINNAAWSNCAGGILQWIFKSLYDDFVYTVGWNKLSWLTC